MIIDPLRPTTNFGMWEVTCMYNDSEDNSWIDFSGYPNIIVEVEDPFCRAIVMTLSRSNGVTTPAPGIIEWRAGKGQMGGLREGTYHVRMYAWIDNQDDTLPLMDSSVSIIGDKSQ